ncbi:MAG: pirin family protein [Gammaproteobacteria bacterium]|jgi:redox-sensitive bicupin YhaK (pirin superfamily)|nr:pirin family protein [Gammaproteobacteria bacterium]MBQ0774943.1 pirin family protein [Gammaproteobacteria bacterium]|tara:strand:- start:37012 stop:37971 length:960 start_codon:yes stop_codon:yes gene_type:complete
MSSAEINPPPSFSSDCPAAATTPALRRIEAREALLGGSLLIRRALPNGQKRMIGAWCFLDHAGPADVSAGGGMRVGPHPHTGLQTFSWLIEGEVLHRDSLGYEQILRPGQVNLMTAGRGISHSEESPDVRPDSLQLAQLWIALPDAKRHCEPAFEHHPVLPKHDQDGFTLTLLVGEAFSEKSPAKVYSPLVAIDITTDLAEAKTALPLRPEFEYGVLVLEGSATVCGELVEVGTLLDLGCGRTELTVNVARGARVLLIGGEPFDEEILLWWNYVGRTAEEISEYDRLWNETDHFGEVKNFDGTRLPSPPIPVGLKSPVK